MISNMIIWFIYFIASNGIKKADIPRIKRILKIFEPRTFPTAISDSSLNAAIQDTTNSGSEVPIATIDNAITKVGMPKKAAITFADHINK